MADFIHDDFLLQSKTAQRLYHEYASSHPIVDYHNHLPPGEILEDATYANITDIWLKGDHYKWRAMRIAGIPEQYITGKDLTGKSVSEKDVADKVATDGDGAAGRGITDRDKFLAWAKTVPLTLKNPLYHWTHLELKRYFDIDEQLNEDSAARIWDQTTEMLQSAEFSTRNLLKKMNVQVICTTDDAADSLEEHKQLEEEGGEDFVMFPTYRPDNAMKVEDPAFFGKYVRKLESVSGITISGYPTFLEALRKRHDYFHERGCRSSDHGIEEPFAEEYTEQEAGKIFQDACNGIKPDAAAERKFKSALMHEFAVMDHEKGWAFQMHIGAMRNNNTKMYHQVGPDAGFDSIGDSQLARPLVRFLDRLELNDQLPKTILYNLNSTYNEVLASLVGTFMGGGIPGKIQHGAGWWFHDQKEGMEAQLQTLSNMSLLSQFVGMVTDSRSFLSFPRHEYYRRILCNMLGSDVEAGIVPDEDALLADLLEKLCCTNALRYFSYSRLPKTAPKVLNNSK